MEGMKNDKLQPKEEEWKEIDKRLERAEAELARHKDELEKKMRAEQEKEIRIEKKRRKEKQWEMLRWITSYIDKNKPYWDQR